MSIVLVVGKAEVRAAVCTDHLRGFDIREVPDVDSVTRAGGEH